MPSRITKAIWSLMILTAFVVAEASAQTRVPQFTDYPVKEQFKGKTAPLVLTNKDRAFRTRLREAAKERPNFAGRYILAAWGCGAECLMGALIDAKTGRVHWIPFSLCCWGTNVDNNFKPIEFRPDSRLIVFSGSRNEEGKGTYYYKFENNRFVLIHFNEMWSDQE
jgi:hypothetical protein